MAGQILICLTFFIFEVSFAKPFTHGKLMERRTEGTRFFEEHFNESIECIRRNLIYGNLERGVPSFAPLIMNKTIPLKLDNKLLWTNLELDNVVVDGLTTFHTTSINLSDMLQLDIGYHFDKISTTSIYNGKLNVMGLIGLFGDGNFSVEITDLNIATTTQYSMLPPLVNNFNFTLDVAKIKIRITGLLSDEALSYRYSLIASRVATTLVNQFPKHISDLASPFIKDYLNARIGHLPFLDYLAKVTNLTCNV